MPVLSTVQWGEVLSERPKSMAMPITGTLISPPLDVLACTSVMQYLQTFRLFDKQTGHGIISDKRKIAVSRRK